MKAIGFRVEPARVFWAVVEGPEEPLKLIASGNLVAPESYSEAAALSWYRTETKNLIAQYKPDKTGVRYPETNARQSKPTSANKRSRIEGVLLEISHRSGIETLTATHGTMTSHLGAASSKAYLKVDSLRGLDWSTIKDLRREAILVAASCLE